METHIVASEVQLGHLRAESEDAIARAEDAKHQVQKLSQVRGLATSSVEAAAFPPPTHHSLQLLDELRRTTETVHADHSAAIKAVQEAASVRPCHASCSGRQGYSVHH